MGVRAASLVVLWGVLFLAFVAPLAHASDESIKLASAQEVVSRATYIDPASRTRLNDELRAACEAEAAARSKPGVIRSAFSRAFSKLTILNVLYFLGALIVIGAMTLFVTLGFDAWGGTGLAIISGLYFIAFLTVGRWFWADPDYRLVGGLLTTCALAFVPLGTFGVQKLEVRVGPQGGYRRFHQFVDKDYVVMEITTVIAGAALLYLVPFPFLTMPVAFVLVYMGMDTVPMLFLNRSLSTIERCYVGMFFGVDMMAAGLLLQKYITVEGDFGFWLFLFGTPVFWLSLSTMPPSKEVKKFIYTLINIMLLFLGHYLDRTTVTFWGSLGVLLPSWFLLSNKSIVWKIGRLLASILLLALAQPGARTHGYDLEYLVAVSGVIAYAATLPLDASTPELYYLQFLSGNLGFILLSSLFTTPLSVLGIFEVPRAWLLALAGSLGVLVYFLAPYANIESPPGQYFQLYRSFVSFGLMLLSVPLKFPPLLWIGAIGVHAYHYSQLLRKEDWVGRAPSSYAVLRGFALSLALTLSSVFFESLVVFYLSVRLTLFTQDNAIRNLHMTYFFAQLAGVVVYYCFCFRRGSMRHFVFPVVSVLLLVAGVLTQSQLVMTIVGIGLFVYFSYLAAEVFHNSLMFPLALSAIGGGLIYIAVKLQQHGPAIYAVAERALPDWSIFYHRLEALPAASLPIYWTVPFFGFVQSHIDMALPAVALTAGLCFLWSVIERFVVEEDLPASSTPKLVVSSVEAEWPTQADTEEHGLRLIITAKKPSSFTLYAASLKVNDDGFWRALERMAGSTLISAFKLAAYPISLIPSMMSADDVVFGEEDCKIIINLGTGSNGSRRICHATIRSSLNSLIDQGGSNYTPVGRPGRAKRQPSQRDMNVNIWVEYRTKQAEKRGLLFSKQLSVRELLDGMDLPRGTRFMLH